MAKLFLYYKEVPFNVLSNIPLIKSTKWVRDCLAVVMYVISFYLIEIFIKGPTTSLMVCPPSRFHDRSVWTLSFLWVLREGCNRIKYWFSFNLTNINCILFFFCKNEDSTRGFTKENGFLHTNIDMNKIFKMPTAHIYRKYLTLQSCNQK